MRTGTFFLTTIDFVKISYRYLSHISHQILVSLQATYLVKDSLSAHVCRCGCNQKLHNKAFNYSEAARQFGKNSKASTTNTMPAAWGKNSSNLGRRRECPGTSTRCTGLTLSFCEGTKVTIQIMLMILNWFTINNWKGEMMQLTNLQLGGQFGPCLYFIGKTA